MVILAAMRRLCSGHRCVRCSHAAEEEKDDELHEVGSVGMLPVKRPDEPTVLTLVGLSPPNVTYVQGMIGDSAHPGKTTRISETVFRSHNSVMAGDLDRDRVTWIVTCVTCHGCG